MGGSCKWVCVGGGSGERYGFCILESAALEGEKKFLGAHINWRSRPTTCFWVVWHCMYEPSQLSRKILDTFCDSSFSFKTVSIVLSQHFFTFHRLLLLGLLLLLLLLLLPGLLLRRRHDTGLPVRGHGAPPLRRLCAGDQLGLLTEREQQRQGRDHPHHVVQGGREVAHLQHRRQDRWVMERVLAVAIDDEKVLSGLCKAFPLCDQMYYRSLGKSFIRA